MMRHGGASGEALDAQAAQRTDRLLGRLSPPDWSVIRDVDRKRRVDVALVGRRGVFAIASRQPEGAAAARMKDGMLWLRRGSDPRDDRAAGTMNRDPLEAAKCLERSLSARLGTALPVKPVIVLWCEFPQAVAECRRVVFVEGRRLLDWVGSEQLSLDRSATELATSALRSIASEGVESSHARWLPALPHPRRAA